MLLRGATPRAFVVLRDITEQKRAEATLRESEQAFVTFANHIPQIVWMCTPDGMNIYFNRRWVEYTGMSFRGHLRSFSY